MNIQQAQHEMRSVFLGGFAGQLVSGLIWLIAAAVSTWGSAAVGMACLFFGSMFIFPLTQGLLRLLGSSARVSKENGLWHLGTQIAFTVPINFLLVGAATLYNQNWFFPAALVVVGSHYLPFITLYGMKMFGILAALLVLSGAGLALYGPSIFSLGGWVGGALFLAAAFAGRWLARKEQQANPAQS
ncbi:MAG: hypothetical protein HPY85_15955 [Anaerolineae bacterium]|nr:hypothetical protein [Anaerolineae bacterium]